MSSLSLPLAARRFRQDALLASLAIAQGLVFLTLPSAPVIALGIWWNSNTISHRFIHRPFFPSRAWNLLFGAYLSVLLGIPQALWRDRHLAHHADLRPHLRISVELLTQVALVLAFWAVVGARSPRFLFSIYLPGYAGGLAICFLHSHYEHVRGTTSHYGSLYNFLCFNDGYHAEHHAFPGLEFSRLPERREPGTPASNWPAPLRWIESLSLDGLERLVLHVPALQHFVLQAHARAFRSLAESLPAAGRVGIVGGGLFPRTALLLRQLLPEAALTIIDSDRANLEQARAFLGDSPADLVHAHFPSPAAAPFDLLVIPLAFQGDRNALYRHPPAPTVLIHDWIWRKRGVTRIVSPLLLKRVNLVKA
ncbi:MAG TPA: fatty acid desaturase [Bryobacteraceae bacterium]|nr:fatty acid desaturase [Bryobacteraceae bacterium]